MNKNKLVFLCLFLLISAGCFSIPEPPEKEKTTPPADPILVDRERPSAELYAEALTAEQRGQHVEAIKLYSLVIGKADSTVLYQSSILTRARLLMFSGETETALASLNPLSDQPQTFFDCRKLAMAGRIMERKQQYEDAESLYEVALTAVPKGKGTEIFRAEAFAALGKVYIRNQKADRAVAVFQKAAILYSRNNLPRQAEGCREIIQILTQPE